MSQLKSDQAKLEHELANLEEIWQREKNIIKNIRQQQERLDELRVEMDIASRNADYEKMSKIQYGQIPELEKEHQCRIGEEQGRKPAVVAHQCHG